jgi:hypothetical protein
MKDITNTKYTLRRKYLGGGRGNDSATQRNE